MLTLASAGGQEMTPPLERELAAKLVALANRVRVDEVTVGPMQKVQEHVSRTWTATGGICVTFIAPVFDEGRRVREVQKRVLFHDVDWGWYLFSIEDLRGGGGIDIVSEHKGRFVLR